MPTVLSAAAFPAGTGGNLPDPHLRAAVRERLLSLNFHAFARAVAQFLERSGYEQVRLAGRTDWKGRNRAGGYDLTAVVRSGPIRRRVVAQLKQFPAAQYVYQRSVDELRGVALRAGAAECLLVTTGRFSAAMQAEQVQAAPLAPVRLIDGAELADLMVARRVGVRTGAGGLELDKAWFADLERLSAGNGRADCAPPGGPRFVVTVAVEPLPWKSRHSGRQDPKTPGPPAFPYRR